MHNQKTSVQFLGDHPVFVDGFPKDCDRSVQGSLHLYPRRLIEITAAELSYLKDKRVDIFKLLKVTPTPRERKEAPKSQPPKLAKAEPIQEQPKEEIQEEASSYEKKWKKKGKGFEGV